MIAGLLIGKKSSLIYQVNNYFKEKKMVNGKLP